MYKPLSYHHLNMLATELSHYSGDYVFMRIRFADGGSSLSRTDLWHNPIRIDGMVWMLCFEGALELEVNLSPCHLDNSTMTIIVPGSIVELKNAEARPLDCYVLYVSTDFLKDVNFDINVLGRMPRIDRDNHKEPVMRATEGEAGMMRRYCELLHLNAEVNGRSPYSQSIGRSMVAALVYQSMQMASVRITAGEGDIARPSRRVGYVHEFMDLVKANFRTERSVAYYASRLCITPKYLSLIIKEQTGHGAGAVIDRFVILEAKNLLRFSGKNVQQVANELNFPSQSAFGKYFKHITGKSPSEFQHS